MPASFDYEKPMSSIPKLGEYIVWHIQTKKLNRNAWRHMNTTLSYSLSDLTQIDKNEKEDYQRLS